MTKEEQLYYNAGISFAKKLKICKANKWTNSYEAIQDAIKIRINKVREQQNLIEALNNGLHSEK